MGDEAIPEGDLYRGGVLQQVLGESSSLSSYHSLLTKSFQEARDSYDPYPSAQNLFERGRAEGEDDMFNDMFKKDFIEVTTMKARRKMRAMRIDPYPDAIIRRGLHKKEPRETAKPILEEAMMYTSVVGMEMLEGLAMTSDTVDRMVLEASERKAEVDGALVHL